MRELDMPDFRDYAVPVERPGVEFREATRVLGGFLRDIVAANPDRFRIVGPDEDGVEPFRRCSRRRTGPGTPPRRPVMTT